MAIANMLDCTPILVPSTGFDLGSYEYISRRIDAEYFCFLNSKSVIVADNWLRFLHDHCVGPGIGATGASASFESLYTDHVRSISEGRISRHSLQSVLRRSFANRWRHRIHFPSYPNPHLRTNAFMMNSQVFRRLNFRRIRSRIDTARLENGRISITRQLRQMGLEALVVGKDGAAYRQPDWSRSATFWQLDQGNLLVADNQTEKYSLANPAERTRLSRMAWGADLSKLDVDAAANS